MKNVNQLSVRSGVVEDLSRTIEVRGGTETRTRTTHITMFKVDGEHMEFRTKSPIPLSLSEVVKVVGVAERGLLRVYAMENQSTGWRSVEHEHLEKTHRYLIVSGVVILFILTKNLMSVLISFSWVSLPMLLLIGGVGWFLFPILKKQKNYFDLSKEAHALLVRSPTPSLQPPPLP